MGSRSDASLLALLLPLMVTYCCWLALISLIINSSSTLVVAGSKIVYDEGYTVTTVIDGNKLGINPRSVLPKSGSSDLIVLDSEASTFYTLSFSASGEAVIKRLSGNGVPQYSDGDFDSATFSKPRSFVLDMKNNVYVADKNNHAIRKISKTGVTTIAGGYTQKEGHVDGPAQNATFSNEFELAFIHQRCALMISDHGNKLVRQINLRAEDCAIGSQSALGAASTWALGLGIACLLGFIVGFVVRPHVLPYETPSSRPLSETWKHYLTNQGTQIRMFSCDIRSAIVSSQHFKVLKKLVGMSLSQLTLMFGLKLSNSTTRREKPLSLLDCDHVSSSEVTKSEMLVDQLNDLLTFDGCVKPLAEPMAVDPEKSVVLTEKRGRIDSLIEANFVGFSLGGTSSSESCESSLGLVKRR